MDRFLGVAGYRPLHVHTVGELRQEDRTRLRGLSGQRLVRSWAMWDLDDDEWFTDGPLVLEFERDRLELAAFKLHVCLSWDSIDVARDVVWFEGSSFRLGWRADALAPLAALRDPVDELLVVEYRGGLGGFALRGGGSYAELFNALDELGVTDAPDDDPETVRTPV